MNETTKLTAGWEILNTPESELSRMSRGGVCDLIGGGFFSGEPPCFQKNLRDNALLSYACLDAYARTGRPWFRDIAARTLEYVLRELRLPGGGFASGQDAGDGRYYLLSKQDVRRALESETAGERFCRWYGIGETGESLPDLRENEQYEHSGGRFVTELEKLADYRRRRFPLRRDEEVVTAWNGMAIAALAKAYRILDERRYLQAGESTWMFLRTRLTMPDGTLYHCRRDGVGAEAGQPEDYAYYCWALLELYAANFSVSCLRDAVNLAGKPQLGGLLPGDKIAEDVLDRLRRLTGSKRSRELICVSAESTPEWLAGVAEEYRLTAAAKTPDNQRALERLAPYTAAYPIPERGQRLYLYRDGTCAGAVETLEQLRRQIAEEALPV